ncbi:probable BOI-related E3 ubiquitin-protein ligase 2 [Telopea speciosissima]|uniref:probable BOI-related E3 ubiquitin-protein ligase 2 n=1 Tax=Telopea speciosissima TaxID=54955 RepID=UPI001CC4C057|nr:probable BOI-related E3 ubiquitin-protein ligase 2 [Telopea speciosissima]
MAVQAKQYSENLDFTLGGTLEWKNSSGGFSDLYLNPQQQEQMQQLQNINLLGNHNLGFENSPLLSSSLSMAFSESLAAAQIDKQALEIDRYIQLQNERIRLALQEQRKHQMAIFLRRMESKAVSLLRQKDEDIARAAKRTMELEECLRKAEMENQAWQRFTKEKEAMVMALNNTIEHVKQNVFHFPSAGAEDTGSCCDISQVHPMRNMACKACNSRRSCVLFLPCRHLCSCKSCSSFLDSCPVCNSPKRGSIVVLMS